MENEFYVRHTTKKEGTVIRQTHFLNQILNISVFIFQNLYTCRNQSPPWFSQTPQIKKRGDVLLSILAAWAFLPCWKELIAGCLKVLSLSFSLMSCSSEVWLNLLSQFIVWLNKVQSGCLLPLSTREEGKGPKICFSHILEHRFSLHADWIGEMCQFRT